MSRSAPAIAPHALRAGPAPICLTIAGSDSSGGAGIQADLKTFSALGAYGASAIAALTAQNTKTVSAVLDIPPDFVTAQLDALFDDLNVAAVKIGMLSSREVIDAVARYLAKVDCPIVLDPVMVAKSGDPLLRPDAIDALTEYLLPRASVLTPNLPEAATLLECAPAASESEAVAQAHALLDLGPEAVLLKGGHASGETCVDLLLTRGAEPVRLCAPRIATQHTHGTGCTLSSAIAVGLAKHKPLIEAVREAHEYVHAAIGAAEHLRVGRGRGPVHHFHRIW